MSWDGAGRAGAEFVQFQHAASCPVEARSLSQIEVANAQMIEILKMRHGEEDVTVIT